MRAAEGSTGSQAIRGVLFRTNTETRESRATTGPTLAAMGSLAADTVVDGGGGRYTAEVSSEWEIWGPMGGYAASLALRAAAAEVADLGLAPASFTCQFFRPAAFEPVDLAVEVRRATRRTAATSIRMTQGGDPILDAQCWFAAVPEVVRHDHAAPHDAGTPLDHPDVRELTDEPVFFPFWANLESRPIDWIDDWDTYPGGEPVWSQWLRFVPDSEFDDPIVETCRLLILADLPSFPAASRAHPGSRPMAWIAPNVDLAVQFHRLERLGDWLLCTGTAPVAERGLIGFRSEVWTADGRLAATGSGQLVTRAVAP